MKARQIVAGALAIVLTAGLAVAGERVQDTWRLGYDKSTETCLPYRLYLIRLGQPEPIAGELVAFNSKGLEPFFADGTLFTKIVMGVPGDTIQVTEKGARVRGQMHLFREQALEKLGVDGASLARTYVLGPGEYFMAGTNPRAYDSRYYGPVNASQFAGSSQPIW